MKKTLLILLFAVVLLPISAHAQFSFEIKSGYRNVGGDSGVSGEFLVSYNRKIYFGTRLTKLFIPEPEKKVFTPPAGSNPPADPAFQAALDGVNSTSHAILTYDGSYFLQYHFGSDIYLPSKYSPYVEVDYSPKSIGASVGMNYSLSNIFGLYAQVGHSFSDSTMEVVENLPSEIYNVNNYYGKRFFVMVGVSVNVFATKELKEREKSRSRNRVSRKKATKGYIDTSRREPETYKYRILD